MAGLTSTARTKKIPGNFTVTAPDPGARGATDANWVRNDIRFKESQPQPDYTTGSGSGINNG